jgi:hypothetical protein
MLRLDGTNDTRLIAPEDSKLMAALAPMRLRGKARQIDPLSCH